MIQRSVKNMEQGIRLLKQRGENIEQDLVTARTHFAVARGLLLVSRVPDPESLTQVCYQLMNVEMELSYNKKMSAEEKMSHVQAANSYGAEASSWACSGGSESDLAQVMLQQAVVKGRKAEVDAKLGMSSQEVRRQKDEAILEMKEALLKLKHFERPSLQETTVRAMNWRNRLQSSQPTCSLE